MSVPPVTEVAMASLALIVAGGIYLSSHLPRPVPLAACGQLLDPDDPHIHKEGLA